MRFVALAMGCAAVLSAADSGGGSAITFYKDVLPVLQRNCQTCHRPGEAGPMAFMNYQETRPWAKAIKAAVLTHKMPPWFADPQYGHFQNERKLSEAETRTLVNWADSGAAEGNAKDAPPPVKYLDGWNIKPDLVYEMPQAVDVPASGTVEYTYVVIPTGLTKDTWVTAGEVRPGNRATMHHVIAFIRPPGSSWFKDQKPGVPFIPRAIERDENGAAVRRPAPAAARNGGEPQRGRQGGGEGGGITATENLVGYAPGLQPQRFDVVPGAAKLIPAGSDIVFQLHYTPNGKAYKDVTKIGLTLATEPPKYRFLTSSAAQSNLEIPPNDSNYESHSSITINEPAQLVWLMPHMHVRGKDFVYKAVYPTGETETLLNVPKYDFNWQLGYDEAKPVQLPKGTRIECTAHHDNSSNNKYNPNPNVTVRWGDQTWEEMMIGWFGIVVDANVKPEDVVGRGRRTGE